MNAHDAAMELVQQLAVREEGTLSPGEQDYLDALVVLLEAYDRHEATAQPRHSGLDLLRHLVEDNGLSVSELGRIIGSQATASLILAGRRKMSKRVILRLADHFGVDPGLFLRESDEAA